MTCLQLKIVLLIICPHSFIYKIYLFDNYTFSGFNGSTILPLQLTLQKSCASLVGRLTSVLLLGPPLDATEKVLVPWLQSPLLIGGIDQENLTSDAVDQSTCENESSYIPSASSLLSSSHLSPEKEHNNHSLDFSSSANAVRITDSDGKDNGTVVIDDNSSGSEKSQKIGTKLSWKDAWQNIIDNNNNNNIYNNSNNNCNNNNNNNNNNDNNNNDSNNNTNNNDNNNNDSNNNTNINYLLTIIKKINYLLY